MTENFKPFKPFIACIGGTTRPGSSTEKALRHAARLVEKHGGTARVLAGPDLILPNYSAGRAERTAEAVRLVESLRACDGLIVASPGYHGNYSGLVKNALDYAEDLFAEKPGYLEGRAVGCIASAFGWQAIGTTLVGLRSVIHALKGWNTPIGVSINSTQKIFDEAGNVIQPEVLEEIEMMTREVVGFCRMRHAWETAATCATATAPEFVPIM